MPVDTAELESLRDGLLRAIGRGTTKVRYEGKEVQYASLDEMRRAVDDIERRIAAASPARKNSVGLRISKGL